MSSRIIATERPGKIRNQYRRTIAEALRRFSQKPHIDDEAKDLAALIVFCLHGMADTVDQTIAAWEKRDYWMKAERFNEEWRWLEPVADELSAVIYKGQWGQLPTVLVGLIPLRKIYARGLRVASLESGTLTGSSLIVMSQAPDSNLLLSGNWLRPMNRSICVLLGWTVP